MGTHKGFPYGGRVAAGMGRWGLVDQDDCVDVVWHDDELVQFDRRKSFGQFTPDALDHLPGLVQAHLFVNHVAKETQVFLNGNGHEVGADLCVVV